MDDFFAQAEARLKEPAQADFFSLAEQKIDPRPPEVKAQDVRLGAARDWAKDWLGSHKELAGVTVRDVLDTSIPFVSAGRQVYQAEDYKSAKKAYEEGKATDEQLGEIAKYELLQERKGARGIGGTALHTALGLPAIAGEFAMGPAALLAPAKGAGLGTQALYRAGQGVLTPSLVAPAAEQRSVEQGGEAYDAKNLGPAAAMAALKGAVLGTVGPQAQAVPTAVGRTLAGTALGIAENQVGDAALSAVDTQLNEAYQTKTKWGTVGHFLRGENGEGWKQLAGDAVAFGVFAAAHGKDVKPVEALAKAADALHEAGVPPETAAKTLQDAVGNPDTATGPIKEYVEALQESQKPAETKPANPIESLSPEELKDLAKAVGWKPAKLKEHANEPWVAQLVDAIRGKGPTSPASEPSSPTGSEPVPGEIGPQPAPQSEKAPAQDRRQNLAERKRVADMTPEERAKELLHSQVVDLPNRRAFDEAGPAKAVGMSDADGLKALNDKFGYEAGNALLRAKAEALKEAGLDAYHEKGDEFLYRGDDPAELRSKLDKARSILKDRPIQVTLADGTVKRFKGADFSFGVADHELSAAEAGLKAHKAEREARGERARGELRGIAEFGPEAGQENRSPARPEEAPQGPVNLFREPLPKTFGGRKKQQITLDDAHRERDRSGEPPPEMGRVEDLPTKDTGLFQKGNVARDQSLPDVGGGKPPGTGLVVANVGANGKIYYGEPGQVHADLSGKYQHSERGNWRDVGFAGPDGKFLTREEAFAVVEASGRKFRPSPNMEGQLDAMDYREQVRPRSAKERFEAGEPVRFDEVAKEKGLSPLETHVMRERQAGRSFEEIARDPEAAKPNGKPFTRQRIEQVERQARAKLGLGESVRKAVHDREQVERGRVLAEQAGRVAGKELKADPEEVKATKAKKLSAAEQRVADIEAIGTELLEGKINAEEANRRLADLSARGPAGREAGPGGPEGVLRQPGEGPGQAPTPPGPRKGLGRRVQNDNLKQYRAPRSLITEIRKGGGVSKESAREIGLDVDALASVRPSPFEDARGNPSKRHIEDVIPELVRSGDLTENPSEHLHDTLRRKIERGDASAEGVEAADWGKKYDEFLKSQVADEKANGTDFEFGFNDPNRPVEFGTMLSAEERTKGQVGGGQENAGPSPTGLKETALANARVDAERAKNGLPPLMATARKTNPEAWDKAMARLAEDPNASLHLVDELSNKTRATTIEENALLLHRKVALSNEYERSMRNAIDAMMKKQPDQFDLLSARADELLGQIDKLDKVTRSTGTEWGRAGQFRKQLADEAFTLTRMMQEATVHKKGPLTPEEMKEIAGLHDRIKALEEELAKVKDQGGEKGRDETDVEIEINREKKKYRDKIEIFDRAHKSTLRRTGEFALNTASLYRAFKTAYDFSAVLRQGGFLTLDQLGRRPAKVAQNIGGMIKDMISEHHYDRNQLLLSKHPDYEAAREADLYLADKPELKLQGKKEEGFMGEWPWLRAKLGIAASERAYNGYLNRLRLDAFSTFLHSGGKNISLIEAKALANWVNVATGRGKLPGSLEKSADIASQVLFAPRNLASRFQILAGQPFYGGTNRTRKIIAASMGRSLAALGLFYGLFKVANSDAEYEWDPRSADFGKIKLGNYRIDPLAGLSQTAVFVTRLLGGEFKSTTTGKVTDLRGPDHKHGQTDTVDVTTRFVRNKLSPAFSLAADAATGRTAGGEDAPTTGTLKRIARNQTTSKDKAAMAREGAEVGVPIIFRDIYEAMTDQGVPRGSALSLLAILGMGTQLYDRKVK